MEEKIANNREQWEKIMTELSDRVRGKIQDSTIVKKHRLSSSVIVLDFTKDAMTGQIPSSPFTES